MLAIAKPTSSPIAVGCSPMCRDMAKMVLAVRMASSIRPAATSDRNLACSARATARSRLHVGEQRVDSIGLEPEQNLPVGIVEPGRLIGQRQRTGRHLSRVGYRQPIERHRPERLLALERFIDLGEVVLPEIALQVSLDRVAGTTSSSSGKS